MERRERTGVEWNGVEGNGAAGVEDARRAPRHARGRGSGRSPSAQ